MKESFLDNINSMVKYATEVATKAICFASYYVLTKLTTTSAQVSTSSSTSSSSTTTATDPRKMLKDVFHQDFFYGCLQAVRGIKVTTEKKDLKDIQAIYNKYIDEEGIKDKNYEIGSTCSVKCAHVFSSMAKDMTTNFTNNIVLNFIPRYKGYLFMKLRIEFIVSVRRKDDSSLDYIDCILTNLICK